MRRALVAVALVLASACASTPEVSPATDGPPVPRSVMPDKVGGLRTKAEDVSAQVDEAADRAFISDLKMWSLREGKRLRATIEVARFIDEARPGDDDFRRSMAAQLGSAQARLRRIGRALVFVAPGNSQTLFLWFRGEHFLLLSVSTEYDQPRSLARAAIGAVRP